MSEHPVRARVREFISNIEPYQPGRPVEEVEREMKIRAIKLASNENPLAPSPAAIQAAHAFSPASGAAPQRTR